jgi:hypothetical protein
MAQAVRAQTPPAVQWLAQNVMTLIPGLAITVLTGAGWILLKASGHISNVGAASLATLALYVDGVQCAEELRSLTVPANGYAEIMVEALIKPGAGQHTFAAYGMADAANRLAFLSSAAQCLMIEPGF